MMKRKQKVWMLMMALLLTVTVLSGNLVMVSAEEENATEVVTKTFTFQGDADEAGDPLEATSLSDLFFVEAVTGAGGNAEITGDGNARLTMYAHAYIEGNIAAKYLKRAYTFQVDFYSTAESNGAMYVRAIDPLEYTIANPVLGVDQIFAFYEWDWYAETGGEQGGSETGGSGIKVYQTESNIVVDIKTYVEDGLNIMGRAVELDFPEGFKQGTLNTYKFVDDGASKVEIYVNDVLLCTVEYGGEPATYPDGDNQDSAVLYYKNAVVKGADGTELLSLDNARICAEYSTLAFGNRGENNETLFNNIVLNYEVEQAVATPTPEATATPSATNATSGTNTQNPGSTGDNGAQTGSDTQPTDSEGDDGVALIVGICAAVAVIAVVVIIVAVKKKK